MDDIVETGENASFIGNNICINIWLCIYHIVANSVQAESETSLFSNPRHETGAIVFVGFSSHKQRRISEPTLLVPQKIKKVEKVNGAISTETGFCDPCGSPRITQA